MTWIPCQVCGNFPCTCSGTVGDSIDWFPSPSTITAKGNEKPIYYFSVYKSDLLGGLTGEETLALIEDIPADLDKVDEKFVVFRSDSLPSLQHWRDYYALIREIGTRPSQVVLDE